MLLERLVYRARMGAWATGIFSEDDALDVRDTYREHIADGYEGAEAKRRLLRGSRTWLGRGGRHRLMAATQWELGRLEEDVKRRALETIDLYTDLKRPEGPTRCATKAKRLSSGGLRRSPLGPPR